MISREETREDVYCTLLTNDDYVPGAIVLAHSLRDGGTKKKLAVLVTDAVRNAAISKLKPLYDYVIRVENIRNSDLSKLELMGRPDLASTFTKIALWKQVQFRKIVFVDADALCLRAPDELFDLDTSFAAAPDAGWPDTFNSGVLVLEPSLEIFDVLLEMAKGAESIDGGDQGLLNLYFPHFERLAFLYNVTTFKTFRLNVPALQHFHDDICIVHFTGAPKPWAKAAMEKEPTHPYEEFYNWTLKRWWAVHDEHLKVDC